MMVSPDSVRAEEGLSAAKARLEARRAASALRDASSPFDKLRVSAAPQGERGLGEVRGKLTANAPLAPLVWFKSGGPAEWLFEPKDLADLQGFLRDLDPATPVMALGLGSNLIVRDGGVPGVVVRLGKAFAKVTPLDASTLDCGGGASGILVSSTARDHGIAGVEFLRSIPGTVGGFVRMNGGAYGGEVKDILVDCDVVLCSGELVTLPVAPGFTSHILPVTVLATLR